MQVTNDLNNDQTYAKFMRIKSIHNRPRLLEAWLALTSIKYHGNLKVLIPRNQQLALTRLQTTGPGTATVIMHSCINITNNKLKIIGKKLLIRQRFAHQLSKMQG